MDPIDRFCKLLEITKPLDPSLENILVAYYSSRLTVVRNKEQAQALYDEANLLPRSQTRVGLRTKMDLFIDGPFASTVVSRSALVFAFQGTVPRLVKLPQTIVEAQHEYEVYQAIKSVGTANLVPVEFIPIESRSNISGETQVNRGGLVMPISFSFFFLSFISFIQYVYTCTLHQVPIPVKSETLVVIAEKLIKAVETIHRAGYGHNDIKSTNIFLDNTGELYLGDYGIYHISYV